MRIPGTRKLEARLVGWFEVTDSDKRVLTRGVRDMKSTAVGAVGGYIASGGDLFSDPKGAVVFAATSAVAAMVGKHTRERIGNGGQDGSNGTDPGT